MKKCGKCKEHLLLDSFGRNRSTRDGLSDRCKPCRRGDTCVYDEQAKIKKREYYLAHKDHVVRRVNDWIDDNQGKHRSYENKSRNKIKHEVFSKYCDGKPQCQRCKIEEFGLLTIDHIDGNGGKHRIEIFGRNVCGYKMYVWLKRNNYPNGFQVLCWNCQYRKRIIEMKSPNPTIEQQRRANYCRSIKIECLDHYGGRQCSCSEDDLDVLTLDHVNDDGAAHRRQTSTNFYWWIRKNGFPQDIPLQVLCLNCNIRKRNEVYAKGKNRPTNDNYDSAELISRV